MSHWTWIEKVVVWAVHEAQLAEHGGSAGVRDAGLLASALARPLNLVAYGEPDAAALAAAYGFGIARNHPFIDGNKRTAFVCTELFLVLNGASLTADTATQDSDIHIKLGHGIGQFEWLTNNHARGLTTKELVQSAVVDGDTASARTQEYASGCSLATASAVVLSSRHNELSR